VSARAFGRASLGRRFAVLRTPNVRRFFLGYLTSNVGTAMSATALAFAVLDSGHDASGLGIVFAAGIVPEIAFMLAGGVLADRLGRRQVMLSADLARGASQGALAALVFAGNPPVWAFAGLTAVVGAGNAFFTPALTGLTVEVAKADELGDANALFGVASSAANVVGPALAGILIGLTDPATVLAIDAGTYLASAIALAGLRLPNVALPGQPSIVRQLAAGWVEFKSRRWISLTTTQFALFNLLTWGPFLLLGPVVAHQSLDGARSWGFILAGFGAGSVLGGILVLGRKPGHPLVVATAATLGYPIPVGMLALGASTPEVALAAVVGGIGSAVFNVYWSTTIQHEIPKEAQARVQAFALVGAYSAGPIAFAAAGPVAAATSPKTVLAFGAAWSVLATLAVLSTRSVRAVTWPGTPGYGRNANTSQYPPV
jgi:MFS family permease